MAKTISEIFSHNLRKEREKQNLSQRELSIKADVTNVSISRIELGGATTLETAAMLADGLGIDLVDLLKEVE